MRDFRVLGIMLVKNEADILRFSIRRALEWCDRIYVYDTGSEDLTWSVVSELAASDARVVPFAARRVPFSDSLRGEVFRRFAGEARPGDWWCRLDADEVYIDNPRDFLRAVPFYCHGVWSIHFQYVFTTVDLERIGPCFDSGPGAVTDESQLPRHYVANYSEPRFFRHRERLRWHPDASWPSHMGLVCPRRIRLKHFQYRSPAQIQLRLDTRRKAASDGYECFGHSLEASWREKVMPPDGLHFDAGDGAYRVVEEHLPRHLESTGSRIVKHVLHASGIWP